MRILLLLLSINLMNAQDLPSIQTSELEGITMVNGKAWQDEKKHQRLNWKQAVDYCESLTMKGYSNWRLPSKNELTELYKQKDELKFFDYYFYWTSLSSIKKPNSAWVVAFDAGFTGTHRKRFSLNTRCVHSIDKKGN